MVLEVKNYKYKTNHKINCFVSALIYAMLNKGISITPADAMLYTNAVNFRAKIDFEENGVPTLEIIPVELDFFDKFAETTNVVLKHYSNLSREEDIKVISDSIKENTCVTAITDQYQIGFAISEQYKKIFPSDARMPHHFITIHGIDTDNGSVLFSEPSFSLRKYDHWFEYDVFENARKSKWYELEINKDLYIVKDVSGFVLPNAYKTFKQQIVTLIEQLRSGLDVMKKFYGTYIDGHDDQQLIATNFKALLLSCAMFDQSGYVYRNYLTAGAAKSVKDRKIVSDYKALEKKWHSFNKTVLKFNEVGKTGYNDYCELYKTLLSVIEYELETHLNTLNKL
jgi:hypothetical protein